MVSSAEYKNESTNDPFRSIQELQGNGNNQVMFANLVTSDGTSANMVFHRRKPSQEDTLIRKHKLQMKDFTLD